METQCPKCRTHLATPWSFCPRCGAEIKHEIHHKTPWVKPQHTSTPGAFGGLLLGMVTAPVLIIVGTLLCLTGLGAFLGIPMIIAGILMPLAGPLFGMGEHQGKCPSCGTHVISVADGKSHYCPTCDKEFALIDTRVARAS